ncbi:related to Cation transport regulator-like protein [Saccharomycodes ludwigii]|uniref:glutathione-specific gamma-glutamylcyclotransferase n=1 Tax=Saccharomycodes ludwigii TaxID=36035 RepID=A0A376B6T5_9ASCO|nr:hypothetical protein SCDLUD_001658 [Saccharomycodes ludwigii]KAH3901874.1 hypothetical protein SCDLUD_001658 [Saccharomycodes ludwigii]SSD59810.1 related to Cation transport regulator-like protein [Saccharomycodes ludwigii]
MPFTQGLWVLGYGSLIYKPPPHYKYRMPGIIYGYARRFWQSSSDHRGTPESPGRVVTLIPYEDIISDSKFNENIEHYLENNTTDPIRGKKKKLSEKDLSIIGVAYYIPPDYAQEVHQYLNVREQDGYTIHSIEIHLPSLSENTTHDMDLKNALNILPIEQNPQTGNKYHVLTSSVYIGTKKNQSFVGLESISDTAKVIASSVGPSGTNYEYLILLYKSINEILNNFEHKLRIKRRDLYLEELVKKTKELYEYAEPSWI